MKISRPLLIVTGLNLVLIAGLVVGGSLLKKEQQALALATEEYRSLEEGSDQRLTLERVLEEMSQEKEALLNQFVTKETVVSFLEELSRFGRLSDATVRIIEVSETEPLVLKMRAVGSFRNVFHFLQILEMAPYQFKITETALSHGGEIEGASSWTLDLTLQLIALP